MLAAMTHKEWVRRSWEVVRPFHRRSYVNSKAPTKAKDRVRAGLRKELSSDWSAQGTKFRFREKLGFGSIANITQKKAQPTLPRGGSLLSPRSYPLITMLLHSRRPMDAAKREIPWPSLLVSPFDVPPSTEADFFRLSKKWETIEREFGFPKPQVFGGSIGAPESEGGVRLSL